MPTIDLGLLVTAINNASAPLRDVAGDVKKVGENAEATSNRLKAIQVVIGGIVLEKTLELGKAFIAVAAKNQLAEIQMSSWAGSAKVASSVMEHFNSTIAASGVENDALAQAFGRLRSSGLSVGDAQKTIDNLVNGITALGSKDVSGSLDGAVAAFQRFTAKGVVSTRELNAVVNSTGITVQEMSKAMGVSITQFYEQLKDKTTGAQVFLDAFNRAAEAKFGNFAQLLGSTVGGALNQFKFHLDDALGHLGNDTTLNDHIALFINNIDKAVSDWIKTISKKDIDNFFQMLRNAAPVIGDIVSLIVDIAEAIVTLADITAKFAAMLPSDAVEFGIIGYVLMGKKGALLLGLIGTMTGQLKTLGTQVQHVADMYNKLPEAPDLIGGSSQYQELLNRLNKKNPDSPIANMFDAIGIKGMAMLGDFVQGAKPKIEELAKTLGDTLHIGDNKGDNTWLARMIGTDAQMKALIADLDKLKNHPLAAPNAIGGAPGNPELAKQLAELKHQADDALSSFSDKDKLLQMQNAGDELGQKIQSITNNTNGWNRSLNDVLAKLIASKLPLSEQHDYAQKIAALEDQINADAVKAIELATKLNALHQKDLEYAEQQAQLALQQANLASQRQIDQNKSGLNAALSGTTGVQVQDQVDQQVLQYKQQILQYQQQINNEVTKQTADPKNASMYQATIDQLHTAIDLTQQLANQTNVSTKMMTAFYQQLGQTMENDIGNGITGLLEGTMTWGDVARQIFGDLISLSVKFLIQLAEQALFSKVAQAASLAASVPIAAAQAAIWGPAAVAASIATFGAADAVGLAAYEASMAASIIPFANGGVPGIGDLSNSVLTGPTLFGVGGEAGTEAVMPLTRIGGKLGVRSEGGGGGNTYEIHVHAIDTQSGLGFIAKHISDIDAGLSHRKVLNSTGARSRR